MTEYVEIARAMNHDYNEELLKHEDEALDKAIKTAMRLGLSKKDASILATEMMKERRVALRKLSGWMQ